MGSGALFKLSPGPSLLLGAVLYGADFQLASVYAWWYCGAPALQADFLAWLRT